MVDINGMPLATLKAHIDDLERRRNATPFPSDERDTLSEALDAARDIYEDRL